MGKTLRIFLVDDEPTGILISEISNWTGKILVGPRSQLDDIAKRKEVSRTGVYCLVGPDPENPLRDRVYVGEGDNVLERLKEHDKSTDKDFWTRTIVIISKDENLTKSHVRYLENKLVEFTSDANRASLANKNMPQPKLLPESETADMEFFLGQVKMVLPVLGFNFLLPKPIVSENQISTDDIQIFTMKSVGIEAKAIESGNEFIVLKGSTVRKDGVPSWIGYRGLRSQLEEDGRITPMNSMNKMIFTEDVSFASPSAAGCVITGSDVSGRQCWLVEGQKITYGEWKDAKVERASNLSE